MTTQLDTRLMPATNTPTTTPNNGSVGEGVKAVASSASRKGEVKRAWDELSAIDREVLLETVRQRRNAQRRRASIESSIYLLRLNR